MRVPQLSEKPFVSYSFSKLEAGRLESLEAQKSYALSAFEHSGFLASQPLTSEDHQILTTNNL
jgi:hypothetical protein